MEPNTAVAPAPEVKAAPAPTPGDLAWDTEIAVEETPREASGEVEAPAEVQPATPAPAAEATQPAKVEPAKAPEPAAAAPAAPAGGVKSILDQPELEAAPAEVPAVKPVEAAKPPEIDPQTRQAADFGTDMAELIRSDPETRLGVLKGWQRSGKLYQGGEQEIQQLEQMLKAPTPAAVSAEKLPEKLPMDQVRLKVKELWADGKEDQAMEFYQQQTLGREITEIKQKLSADELARAEGERRRQVQAQQKVDQERAQQAVTQVFRLPEILPELVEAIDVVDPKTGKTAKSLKFKSKEYQVALGETLRGVSADVSIDDAACTALLRAQSKREGKTLIQFTRELMTSQRQAREETRPEITPSATEPSKKSRAPEANESAWETPIEM